MTINPYEAAQPGHHWESPWPAEKKHSGPGIASFVLSIVGGLLIATAIVAAGVISSANNQAFADDSTETIALGFTIIGLLLMDVIALTLGVVGLCQSDRKKIFAALGSLFSLAIGVGTIGLIAIGLAMG